MYFQSEFKNIILIFLSKYYRLLNWTFSCTSIIIKNLLSKSNKRLIIPLTSESVSLNP